MAHTSPRPSSGHGRHSCVRIFVWGPNGSAQRRSLGPKQKRALAVAGTRLGLIAWGGIRTPVHRLLLTLLYQLSYPRRLDAPDRDRFDPDALALVRTRSLGAAAGLPLVSRWESNPIPLPFPDSAPRSLAYLIAVGAWVLPLGPLQQSATQSQLKRRCP